ncbi:MAG: CDP-alcohol phosphatidyltransferase family protein [Proteobacteria bacterium]|nr:CDP-alcohol phosphatidyltransferase family protein [Pseudomonadota bacterium]
MNLNSIPNGHQENASAGTVSSLLVVLPGGDESSDALRGIGPGTELFGFPLLRRVVLSAESAGFDRIVVLVADENIAAVRALLDATPAVVTTPLLSVQLLDVHRIVFLRGDILPDRKWLASLRVRDVKAGTMDYDPNRAAIIEAAPNSAALSAALSAVKSPEPDTFAALAEMAEAKTCDLGGGSLALEPSVTVAQAEDWLLTGLVKETDGFMARLVARPISLALTRRLVTTPISANAMTVLSTLIGVTGAPFFLSSSPGFQLIGGMLFVTHSVLDGCDGELARLRFAESRLGGLLDYWGDNLVHIAVFSCMAIGWSLNAGSAWPLLAGCAAVFGTIGSAGFVHWRTMRSLLRPQKTGGPGFTSVAQSSGSDVSRILDALARRDFIYLVLLLSAFGKASWFLILAAFGAPLFFLLLLWVAYNEGKLKVKKVNE